MTTIILAAALVALYLVFWGWHSQWGGKLTQAKIDHYMSIIEKLPLPTEEIQTIISRFRPWAEADDGRPVYMVDLMHFFPQLHTFQAVVGIDRIPRTGFRQAARAENGLAREQSRSLRPGDRR